MRTRIFLFGMILTFFVACSSNKQVGIPSDSIYDGLTIGMKKADVIELLGKKYKYDMKNVTQAGDKFVERILWNSPTNKDAAYVLTFINGKLDSKSQERVIQTAGGGNIQINR